MDLSAFRLARRRPFGAAVGVVADQLLLLGVHRDDWLVVIDEALGHVVEVPELAVSVGVLTALGDLGVGLHRIAELMQQAQHRA